MEQAGTPRHGQGPVVGAVAPRVGRLQVLLGEQPALFVTVGVGLAIAVLMAALAGKIYDSMSEADGVAGLDRPVLDAAVRLRTPGLDHAVTLFTDLGGTVGMPIIATVATLAVALRWRRRTPVVLMLVATAGSLLMTVVGKAVVGRVRPPADLAVPPLETSASFPSGHALNSVVVSGMIAYLVVGRLRTGWARAAVLAGAVGFAVAIGLSRVFLGHHWLTDVLVAWALGVGWLAVVITGYRVWLLRRLSAPRGEPGG